MARARVDDAPANEGAAELESPEVTTAEGVLPTFAQVYEKLAAPFDKTYQRQIPGGASLTYITGEQAMSRLTEVLGPHWDWEVTKQEMLGSPEKGYHVVVSGKLTISFQEPGKDWLSSISREGIGGAAVKLKRDGTYMDIGNDFKAAETGALKRAAAKFGVGLYLYEKGEGGESDLPSYGQQGSYAPADQRPPVQFGGSSTAGGTTGPIEAVSMPSVTPEGKQRLGGLKVGGQWFNVSNRAPINLGQFQRGQTVTIAHGPGSTFIDGVTPAGAPVAGQEIEAF